MKAINIEECLGVGVTHMLIPALISNYCFVFAQSRRLKAMSSGGITCRPAVI